MEKLLIKSNGQWVLEKAKPKPAVDPKISAWQEMRGNRADVPPMQGSDRAKALFRLSNQTPSKNIDGVKHYLLHRTMGGTEKDNNIKDGVYSSDSTSSWSANKKGIHEILYSGVRFKDREDYEHVTSAWVPEQHIHNVLGRSGQKGYAKEREVIVAPNDKIKMRTIEDFDRDTAAWDTIDPDQDYGPDHKYVYSRTRSQLKLTKSDPNDIVTERVIIDNNGQWELAKADGFSKKGVPLDHIKKIRDALEHFESPPSAHAFVKGFCARICKGFLRKP
jgi:hypothetical protein